jgi:serine/threonine protein kinase
MVVLSISPPSHSPKEWPKEVRELYEPIRVLGQGGFASVMLAKKKQADNDDSNKWVAVKVVGHGHGHDHHASKAELAYAHREIDILRALNHPNIMRVLHYHFESPTVNKGEDRNHVTASMVICLSYARGPTVEALLQHGGALSTLFSRIVVAQLVDAIACLHSHAVVHRDIKPDNIIVTGASSKDDCVWNNEANNNVYEQEPPWKSLREKWHVTLIDFGFARALTPQDVVKPSLEYRRENLDASFHANATRIDKTQLMSTSSQNVDHSNGSCSRGAGIGTSIHRMLSRLSSTNLDASLGRSNHSGGAKRHVSMSHMLTRKMSALGNRNFAAPEILKGVKQISHSDPKTITDTISDYVAEYGLLVDAYSLGFTIRYMMTGVPPSRRVEDVLAEQTSLPHRLGRWTTKKLFNKKQASSTKRKKCYRLEEDLPGECQRLIRKLTEKSEKQRTSVRSARRYPWINDVLPEAFTNQNQPDEIKYLDLGSSDKQ